MLPSQVPDVVRRERRAGGSRKDSSTLGVRGGGCGIEDDREETVRRRMAVYHENTEPLVDYYRGQGLLRQVDGSGDIERIYASILQALGQAGASC